MTEIIDYSNLEPEFSSTDIELMSTVEASAKQKCSISRDRDTGFGRFTVIYTNDVQRVINLYSAGTLECNAKDLMFSRRRLFREVKKLAEKRP